MGQLVVTLDQNLIKTAFSNIEGPEISTDFNRSALGAGGLSSLEAALIEAWDKIQNVVEESFTCKWEDVQESVQEVTDYLKTVAQNLGNKAHEFQDRLTAKIKEVIQEAIDLMLASVRSEIKIGQSTFMLDRVDLEHKLVFSASTEASLIAFCKFVGSGELVVKGSYSALR